MFGDKKMIDSHAHILSEYYDDIGSFIENLKDKDVLKVINCADSIPTSKEVLDLYKKYDGYLVPAIGIHPENVDLMVEELVSLGFGSTYSILESVQSYLSYPDASKSFSDKNT